MSRTQAVVFLMITALIWSTGGVLIKSVDWPPLAISGARSAIAALMLAILCRPLKWTGSFAQIGGALAYAGTVILFVLANKMTTAANAILLQYTAPIYVALFGAWYLGEKTNFSDGLAIFFAFLGMTLFFLDELTPQHFWGNLVAILSGVSFAWLMLFLRKQKEGSGAESVILGNSIAAVVAIPFFPGHLPSLKGSVLLVLLGVGQLGLSYFLYTKTIKYVPAIQAITILFLEPIFNPLWVLLALGERPGKMALIGGSMILMVVLMRALYAARTQVRSPVA